MKKITIALLFLPFFGKSQCPQFLKSVDSAEVVLAKASEYMHVKLSPPLTQNGEIDFMDSTSKMYVSIVTNDDGSVQRIKIHGYKDDLIPMLENYFKSFGDCITGKFKYAVVTASYKVVITFPEWYKRQTADITIYKPL